MEMPTLLHPPAKLCYILIVWHEVGWSATAQKSNVLLALQHKMKTFSFDILVGWLVADQQEEQKVSENCYE